jgi:ribosomal protein S18 acetylase RimI-like enzyme
MAQEPVSSYNLRVATPEDAAAIAHVHIASAVAAYQPTFGEEYTGGDFDRRLEQWQRILTRDPTLEPPAAERVFVACQDGVIVGFCGVGASRDADAGTDGEVHMLYVHPDYWRSGIGKRLFDAGIAYLIERGFPEATLWVLQENARARSFYEREGWRPDGGRKPAYSRPDIFQIRYRRSLNGVS